MKNEKLKEYIENLFKERIDAEFFDEYDKINEQIIIANERFKEQFESNDSEDFNNIVSLMTEAFSKLSIENKVLDQVELEKQLDDDELNYIFSTNLFKSEKYTDEELQVKSVKMYMQLESIFKDLDQLDYFFNMQSDSFKTNFKYFIPAQNISLLDDKENDKDISNELIVDETLRTNYQETIEKTIAELYELDIEGNDLKVEAVKQGQDKGDTEETYNEPEQDIEPEQVDEPEQDIEPEQVDEPEQDIEPEQVDEPEQDIEPEQVDEPEQDIEPEQEQVNDQNIELAETFEQAEQEEQEVKAEQKQTTDEEETTNEVNSNKQTDEIEESTLERAIKKRRLDIHNENPFENNVINYLSLLLQQDTSDPIYRDNKELVSVELKKQVANDPVLILVNAAVASEQLEKSKLRLKDRIKKTSDTEIRKSLYDDLELVQTALLKKNKLQSLAQNSFVEQLTESEEIRTEIIFEIAKKRKISKEISNKIAMLEDSALDVRQYKEKRRNILKEIKKGEYIDNLEEMIERDYEKHYEKARKRILKNAQKVIENERKLYRKKVDRALKNGAVNDGTEVILIDNDPFLSILKNINNEEDNNFVRPKHIDHIHRSKNPFAFTKSKYTSKGKVLMTENRFGKFVLSKDSSEENLQERVENTTFAARKLMKKGNRVYITFSNQEPMKTRQAMAVAGLNEVYDAYKERMFGEKNITMVEHEAICKKVQRCFKADGFNTKNLILTNLIEPKNNHTELKGGMSFEEEDLAALIKELNNENPDFEKSKLSDILELQKNNSINSIAKTLTAVEEQIKEQIDLDGRTRELDLSLRKVDKIIKALDHAKVDSITTDNFKILFDKKAKTSNLHKFSAGVEQVVSDLHKEMSYLISNEKKEFVNLIKTTAEFTNQSEWQVAHMLVGDREKKPTNEFKHNWETETKAALKQSNKYASQIRQELNLYFEEAKSEFDAAAKEFGKGINKEENKAICEKLYNYMYTIKEMRVSTDEMNEELNDSKARFDRAIEFDNQVNGHNNRDLNNDEQTEKLRKEQEKKRSGGNKTQRPKPR